jgi:threonine dehydrogenase-like Zn-dependent dehydrogenase
MPLREIPPLQVNTFHVSASALPAHGSLQKVVKHPTSLTYHLPDELNFSEGALVEPLSMALHSVYKTPLEGSQTVIITGMCAVDLLYTHIARVLGASFVTIVDVDVDRLKFAKQQGVRTLLHKEEGE